MEKKTLTLSEVLKLNEELDGLIKERLPVYVKFWVHKLKKSIMPDVDSAQVSQKELFDKYGYQENGLFKIKTDGEGYKIYMEETDKMMKQPIEIEYNPFKISSIENIETNVPLDIFFKLVTE